MKLLAELDKKKLVERVKQGQGRPTNLYAKRFTNCHSFHKVFSHLSIGFRRNLCYAKKEIGASARQEVTL